MNKHLLRVALYLRLLLIAPLIERPMWYDENFTLLVVRLPFNRMLTAVAGDVHPPLYYLLLWPLGQIATLPPWALRLPSFAFSLVGLYVFWRILRLMVTDNRVRLAAWTLAAISTPALYYAAEARMYALLGLLLLLGVWMLLERRWAWLGIVTALLVWSHNYGALYAACLWLAGMLRERQNWKPLSLAIGLGGISFLPWVVVLFGQMGAINGNYWMVHLTPLSALYEFYKAFLQEAPLRLAFWFYPLFFGWLTFSLIWIIRRKVSGMWILMVLCFGPFLLAALVSVIWQPVLLYRALTPCAPFLGLLLVMPLQDLPKYKLTLHTAFYRQRFLLACAFVLPMLVINAVRVYVPGLYPSGAGQDEIVVQGVLEDIQSRWQAGDIVLHQGDGSLVDMLPYASHPQAHYKLTPCGSTLGALSEQTRSALGVRSLDAPLGRAWLITEDSPMTPACATGQVFDYNAHREYCYLENPLRRVCLWMIGE